ncbi:MAG: hypothetical protein COC01_02330 [Bacteroidetes bacterium]|nr:hypothetical protein [Bacteroidia bacterium]PCH69051.1 MAG: hypothetical protein COC01_02330 [Bacteroidota bacterium]
MKLVIPFILIWLHLNAQESANQIFPVKFKENIQLAEHKVNQTYKFSDTEFFVVATRTFEEGFQLIYLQKQPNSNRYTKEYISKGKGEAYHYNPYFYKADNGYFIILAEEGYEYMSGVDIYILKKGDIKFIGYVPVSGDQRDSAIPKIKIKKIQDHFEILFSGTIEYKIATDRLIDGSNLRVEFNLDRFNIIEK